MNLVELKKQFLEHLKVELGRSAKTIENYDRYLKRFSSFAKVKKPAELTEEHVKNFRLYLDKQPGTKTGEQVELMKRRTQNYYLTALRVFLGFLEEQGIKSLNPKNIKLDKVAAEYPPDLVFSTELKRLMNAPNKKTLEGKRDRAILKLLLFNGLRTYELTGLCVNDVDMLKGELIIKGRDERINKVLISEKTKTTLQNYLISREDSHDAMFVRYGRKANDGGDLRLSSRALQRLVRKYSVSVGITAKITPQAMRHKFTADLFRD